MRRALVAALMTLVVVGAGGVMVPTAAAQENEASSAEQTEGSAERSEGGAAQMPRRGGRRAERPMRELPDIASVFRSQNAKVVAIKAEIVHRAAGKNVDLGKRRSRVGQGSGVIIDTDGYILTNSHVVADADAITVMLNDAHTEAARLVGDDSKTDLALLKIETDHELEAATLGSVDDLEVGQWVVAMGDPFGLDYSVTVGVISATGRNIGHGPYDDFIQTDASINPGNSGGPLFDLNGNVIGLNTAIIRNGQGIAFSIPVDMIKKVVPELKEKGYVRRGYIGAGIQHLSGKLAASYELPEHYGVLVGSLVEDGPAVRSGLRPGDIVTRFAGSRVRDVQDLMVAVADAAPGNLVEVEYHRDGRAHTTQLTVSERPDASRPVSRKTGGGRAAPDKPRSGRLGVEVVPVDDELAKKLDATPGEGVAVKRVFPGTPASSVLRPGDVILRAAGKSIDSIDDLRAAIETHSRHSRPMRLMIRRGGSTTFVAAAL